MCAALRSAFHAREAVRSIFYAPYLATVQAGFLAQEGVQGDLGVTPKGRDPFEMLNSGEIHVAQNAPSTSFALMEAGRKDVPIHVAAINDRDGFYIVSRKPAEGFRWKDLEGARVVPASFGVQPWACLMFCLQEQGVKIERVTLVEGLSSMQAAEDAFRAGEGDYVHLQNPNALTLVADGVGHLAASVGEALGPIAFSTLAMSRRFLREEPEIAEAFMRAYLAARQWVLESGAETVAEALQPLFPDTARAVLIRSVDGYKALGTWSSQPRIPRQSYERALDMWLAAGQITRRHPYEEVVTNGLIDKALEKNAR